LRAELAAQTARAQAAERDLVQVRAWVSCTEAMVKELKLEIAKLRRDKYGISSERRAPRAADRSAGVATRRPASDCDRGCAGGATGGCAGQDQHKTSTVHAFTRRKPVRKPLPGHLPRERVVIEAPASCSCGVSGRIVKMGEDSEPLSAIGPRTMASETLEVIARQWKVIQPALVKIGREKFTRRACEKISQPPAPFHVIPRGWAGPQLIAMVAFDKYGQHQPLNRQSGRIALEGVDLSLSALADLIGHACVALAPIHELTLRHVLAGARLHGDDTAMTRR
jgi:transposase